MERETKELKAMREEIAKLTAAYLKAGGKIHRVGNEQTDYAKSGLHAYNNQQRRYAAKGDAI